MYNRIYMIDMIDMDVSNVSMIILWYNDIWCILDNKDSWKSHMII